MESALVPFLVRDDSGMWACRDHRISRCVCKLHKQSTSHSLYSLKKGLPGIAYILERQRLPTSVLLEARMQRLRLAEVLTWQALMKTTPQCP